MNRFATFTLLLCVASLALSSGDDLSLKEAEAAISLKIKNHLVQVERQIKSLDYLLNTVYKDYNYTAEDAHEYVSNPINTYMLIKRTSLEWPNVKKVVFNETAEKEFEEIQNMIKDFQEKSGGV